MSNDQGREEEPTSGPDRRPASCSGRRDPRLVTRRRGGLLEDPAHRSLALWAAGCAEHVLASFEDEHPDDQRPCAAIEAARSWAREQVTMTAARQSAYGAHAAARQSSGAAAAAARAAGHAAATAHMADHELASACYALRVITLTTGDPAAVERERRWQVDHLPEGVRDLVLNDMHHRAQKFNGAFDH